MPGSPRAEGFSKRHRFSTRGSFGPALRSARKLRGDAVVLNLVAGRPGATRLGIALTRRLVPRATERNGLKRLVREIFRRHPLKSRGLDCVVALRKPYDASLAGALRAELGRLFDQASTR
jgi:ribonuclease P protein component